MACSLWLAVPAHAAVYKSVDSEGNVTFSNVPSKGSQPIKLAPISSYPSTPAGKTSSKSETKSGASAGASSGASTTPSRYPNVDAATQRQRDGGRRKILEQELANEQQALTTAQQALTEGKATRNGDETRNYPKYLERVKKLQDEVTDRQKNVEALRRELGQS